MEENNYKVSIITVSYNSSKTIEQTIKSVLHQTYNNIEYIVIDGLSTDGTQQVIEKYIDSIAYFVSEKDNGLYYAMNKGIEKATGDIIGIINSDDWYALDAVENVVKYFQNNNVELLYGNTIMVAENGEEKSSIGTQSLTGIWWGIPFMHSSVFVKKHVYEKYGMFDVRYNLASDIDLLLRFYTQKVKFGYINKTIAYFRLGGLSTKKRKESLDEAQSIYLNYSKLAPDERRVVEKINQKYAVARFPSEIEENHNMLRDLVCKYFNKNIKHIIIFGGGIWGKRCFKVLESTDIEIAYFTDNNPQKWNTDVCGIKVINPNELQFLDAYVLIAVMNDSYVIEEQLESMNNNRLQYVSLKDLMELFCKQQEV